MWALRRWRLKSGRQTLVAAGLMACGAFLIRGELEPWVRHNPAGPAAVPAYLPPGRYAVHVTAEDIAHNVGTEEVALEIW